jgi:orotate phosphoribosyltransferase-like protein
MVLVVVDWSEAVDAADWMTGVDSSGVPLKGILSSAMGED